MSKWIKIIFINLLILIGMFAAAEGTVRVFYPQIIPTTSDLELFIFDSASDRSVLRLRPGATGLSYGAKVVVDERGFRIDPAMQRYTDAIETRAVLVLGDSVTFPVGVEAAQGYPYILDRQFPHVEFVNAAVIAYPLERIVDTAIEQLAKLDPVGLVIGICLNDVIDTSSNVGEVANRKQYSNPIFRWLRDIDNNYLNVNPFLNSYSRTYVLLKSMFRDAPRDYLAFTQTAYENGAAKEIAEREFARLAKALKGRDIWLEVFLLPYEYQLRTRDSEALMPQRVLAMALTKANISVTDLYEPMAKQLDMAGMSSADAYLYNDGMHFSVKGNKLIAELIADDIDQHLSSQSQVFSGTDCSGGAYAAPDIASC
jgi:lysophospholipase L1-like esterase